MLKKLRHILRKFTRSKYLPEKVNELFGYIEFKYKSREPLISRNTYLRNTRRDSRCFILATGPSIKQQNLKVLKDEYTIAVNNFYLHSDFNFISPKYYCMTPYHPEVGDKNWQGWMDEFDRSVAGINMEFFFALGDKERLLRKTRFAKKNMYFINFDVVGRFNDNYDLSKPILHVQSVSIMALYVALYLGFKEIYLLGCDHDWIFHNKISRHFYPEDKSALAKNGFSEWSVSPDIGNEFRASANLWDQYRQIREYATRNQIEIYYSTPEGKLDIFPSKSLEEVFPNNNF